MEVTENCRFCNIKEGIYQFLEVDEPFLHNDNYMALASIGALVEGWALIVPMEHQFSMKNHYVKKEFEEFLTTTIEKMTSQYGSLIAFEHGSNKEGSATACGTDHAHLHLVPFKGSLLENMKNTELKWIKCKTSEVQEKVQNQEYLLYYEVGLNRNWTDPEVYLHILEKPISQFFRKQIAADLGLLEFSDYRKNLFLEEAKRTRNILNRLCS